MNGLEAYVIEAEMQVLGAALFDHQNVIGRIAHKLKAEHFNVSKHRTIYQAMVNLYMDGKSTDLLQVTHALKESGELDAIGGRIVLGELLYNAPVSTANVDITADIIIECCAQREYTRLADRMKAMEQNPIDEKLELAEEGLSKIREYSVREEEKIQSIGQILVDLYSQTEKIQNGESDIAPIPTGFYDLDNLLGGGLKRQELIVLAGRPAMGKSALAHQIAYQIAKEGRGATLLFSLEMSKVQVATRIASGEINVPASRFLSGKLSQTNWSDFVEQITLMDSVPFDICDEFTASPLAIAAQIKQQMAKRGNLSLVVIDYLQLMADGSDARLVQQIGDITRRFKLLARECNVPIILLSQLSRNVESRNVKRPQLSDLRDSGRIEEDADIVIGLYRDEYYNLDSPERGIAEAIVLKQRNGANGTVKMLFDGEYTRFKNLARF